MRQHNWRPFVLILAVLGTGTPVRAQVQLEWKLREGDTFYLHTTGTTRQTLKLMGTPIQQEFETASVDRYKVVKKTSDQIVLEKTIESMKVKASGQGADVADQMAQKVKGAVFLVTLDPRTNMVTKVDGVSAFVKKVFADNPIMQKTLSATLSDDSVRDEQQNVLLGYLFDKPVRKGDKWTRKSRIHLGPMGGFATDGEFTYQGKSPANGAPLDRIDAAWTLTYTLPKEKGGLPFEITKGKFNAPTAKGTYWFDSSAGKLVQLERQYTIKGTITMSTLGQEMEMEMEMDQSSKIRLLDQAPKSE
ncbi:MAG TPA: hypothetical protein VKU02_22225 [Gemmataceae bacterium]|nr:hypothetical protein [Gemmataceae bacterium]